MPDQPSKFYLTTPIYYVNARPHIGHAYTTIAADVLARRHRLLGDDVFFLTGTDEHGQKIERSAAAAGVPPQQFADEVAASFAALWQRMGITHNKFIRTTDAEHKRGVQKLFRTLQETGAIYLDSYTGAYCVSDETFVDLPAGTPCPDCGRPLEIVTEENYFFKLSAYQKELIDKIESGELSVEPEARRNEVLSFIRGNIATGLNELLGAKGDPEGMKAADEKLQIEHSTLGNPYVKGAVKDLSISRTSFQWGIPVPPSDAVIPSEVPLSGTQSRDPRILSEDASRPGAPSVPESHPGTGGKTGSSSSADHVIYVWLDALANYITAVGYGSDAPEDIASFAKYWPADLHLVGKEIIRFHCVYWPAFLLAAGLPLPKKIQAHGWLLFEESKMSKSRGNIVRTETILDAFGDHYRASLAAHNKKLESDAAKLEADTASSAVILSQTLSEQSESKGTAQNLGISPLVPEPTKDDCDLFATDVLRYFLLREIPFGQDGSFSFDALITRYNADLANGYGNLVSRTLKLTSDYFPNGFSKTYQARFSNAIDESDLDVFVRDYWYVGTPYETGSDNLRTLEEFVEAQFKESNFAVGLTEIFVLIRKIDGYLADKKPWKLAKLEDEQSRDELGEVLYTAVESIRIITALLYPVMPHSTAKVWAQLGLGDIEKDSREGKLKDLKWGGLVPGKPLGPLAPIFPRAPKELAQVMSDIESQSNPAKPTEPTPASPNPVTSTAPSEKSVQSVSSVLSSSPEAASSSPEAATPLISIDDFAKVDLRVARVLVAERIPKADRLLRLEVDLGYEKRQVLAGIAQFYAPETLIGRKIVIVANLAPRKMRGLESQGMVVAASVGPDGTPVLAGFLEDVEIGARLK